MDKKKRELLELKLEQDKFKCNVESNRFYAYVVLMVVIFLTFDLSKFNWNWFFLAILLIVTGVTLDRLLGLRKDIDKNYKALFDLINK